MSRRRRPDPKVEALRQQGALNPDPSGVSDPLFQGSDFFDPRDRVQVKYEMLRRARINGGAVTEVAGAFGVSRPTFYQTQAAFQKEGLPGILPKKRGPRGGHKLTQDVLDYLQKCLVEDNGSLDATELARRIAQQFRIRVHPRSIEKALARQKKKRR
jgi:transposase